jgi:hypothetical protein
VTTISYQATIRDVQAQSLSDAGPFASREWFERIEASQRQAVYAVAEDASGAVVLPLCRNGRKLETLLAPAADSWRPLATPYGSLDSLLIALAAALAEQTSHIVLDRLPDGDGTTRQLQRAFERAGWLVVQEPAGQRARAGQGNPPNEASLRHRLRCWRKGDPRNWFSIVRMLVSGKTHR